MIATNTGEKSLVSYIEELRLYFDQRESLLREKLETQKVEIESHKLIAKDLSNRLEELALLRRVLKLDQPSTLNPQLP